MKLINRKKILLFLAFFATLFFLIPCNALAGETVDTGVSASTNIQLIEGKIKQYNPETKSILLQLKNREKVTILLDWNTELVGYDSLKGIEKGHKVKIWHSGDDKTPKAIKIEKKLMVGC